MTNEQRQKLIEIGKEISKLFPDMYGSIRFNLNPNRRNVNFNLEQSYVSEEQNSFARNV